MPKHVNAASRLHKLVSSAAKDSEQIAVYAAWARAAGIEEPDGQRRILRVAEAMEMMMDEIIHVRQSMEGRGFSEDLYVPQLKHLQDTVLSPGQLLAPWSNLKGNITSDILLSLNFCSEILPNEEEEITAEQLKELLAEIESLQAAVDGADLPAGLKGLIRRQLERLRKAVAQYNVVGAKALREAANHSLVDVLDHREEVAANNKAPELSRLGKLIERASRLADGVIKADKFIEASNHLIALANKMMGY